MEKLEQKLSELRDLIKANLLPSPNPPQAPAAPTVAPTSKKNPLKVAQQIQIKPIKAVAVKAAKETLKVAKNGQWNLNKAEIPSGQKVLIDSHEKKVNTSEGSITHKMELHQRPTHWQISIHKEGEPHPQVYTGKEPYIRQKWKELKKAS